MYRTIKRVTTYRIGYGEDAHALVENRPLIIGNVPIPDSPRGSLAHSDGDVLLHALTDALLSAFSMGDIGHYYPPANPNFKDMDSSLILQALLPKINSQHPFTLINLAAVITLDKPKLGIHRQTIQARVANLLGIAIADVGLTFKTSEGLAPNHIQARVTILLDCL